MAERLTEEQKRVAKEKSKLFEHSWRVFSHPKDYSADEIKKASEFITTQVNHIRTQIQLDNSSGDLKDAEIFSRLFMGVLHYPDFQVPPELKYHPNTN